jgi:hypothetical protein
MDWPVAFVLHLSFRVIFSSVHVAPKLLLYMFSCVPCQTVIYVGFCQIHLRGGLYWGHQETKAIPLVERFVFSRTQGGEDFRNKPGILRRSIYFEIISHCLKFIVKSANSRTIASLEYFIKAEYLKHSKADEKIILKAEICSWKRGVNLTGKWSC